MLKKILRTAKKMVSQHKVKERRFLVEDSVTFKMDPTIWQEHSENYLHMYSVAIHS